MVRIYRVWAH